MIEEKVTIIAFDDKSVTVSSQVKSSCGGCAQIDTCGSGQVAKAIPQRKLTLVLPFHNELNSDELKIGDSIVIGIPDSDVLASAIQVYLFPLFGLITFSALGQWLVNQGFLNHELWAFSFGVFGGYLGYRLAKYRQTQSKQSLKLQPIILRTLAT